MAAKTVKMCDMTGDIAARVFQMLNDKRVKLKVRGSFRIIIVTDVDPRNLVYPEGWYYAKGALRNKHMSTTGIYEEVPMVKSNGTRWPSTFCTLYDD